MSVINTDTIKRLIHSASQLVRQLDAVISRAKSCRDLFTPEAIELRHQLSMLCAKSILADPIQCRKKAEELLWKKCYYDVISSAKILAKKAPLSELDKFYLESHINSGLVKFSEHLQEVVSKLQKLDPPVMLYLNVLPTQAKPLVNSDKTEPKEDLLDSLQRTLIWLGDLSRYKIDLAFSSNLHTAKRLYHQALVLNPSNGLPFNQLGTLTSHENNLCYESTFYYVRSIKSPKIFLGAEPNLKALLSRLSNNDDKLVASFSQLFLKLALKAKEDVSFEIAQLCQSALLEIQNRLHDNNACSFLLDTACCAVLCATSNRESNNFQFTAAAAFSCSLFSHLLTKFQDLFGLNKADKPYPNDHQVSKGSEEHSEASEEDEEETKRAKLRRRKVASSSDESSEDEFILNTDSEESQNSEKDNSVTPEEILIEVPSECKSLLPVLKVFTDWFKSNFTIVQVTSNSVQNMWTVFADILNAFETCRLKDTHLYDNAPLEEDWKFYGIQGLVQENLDFETVHEVPSNLVNSIRIRRIISFGKWLANYEKEPSFKNENGKFIYQFRPLSPEQTETNDNKADLMRNMAQLWLKSEVQELERKLSPQAKRKKKTNSEMVNLPYVYVVPDVAAFTKSMRLIKLIVKSQKVIMVIPNVVISEMDQLKKESSSVRDCIRWLETCFRAGNRFVRTQRPNEHEPIPLLTYPKRKDKANWTLFQILECCCYLDTSQKNTSKQEKGGPAVLLLSGIIDEGEQHIRGLCSSIGVDFKTTDSLLRKGKSKKL